MMRRKLWRQLLFCLLGVCMLSVLAGCGSKYGEIPQNSAETEASNSLPTQDINKTPDQAAANDASVSADNTVLNEEVQTAIDSAVDLQIYTIDPDSLDVKAVTVSVSGNRKIDAKTIAGLVTEELSSQSVDVDVLDVTQDAENNVILNFGDDAPPVMNVGSTIEAAILDCYCHSITDNIAGSKVYLRINGGRYETGHLLFELNEAY